MATTTGIELGPDSCLLTAVRSRAGIAEIVALHRLDGADWRVDRQALEDRLRSIRRQKHFPRQASVVSWCITDDDDAAASIREAIGALESAGFRIVSTLAPPDALAKLAASRRRTSPGEAVAWLALNTNAASIAIVRDGDLLYSRIFRWHYQPEQPTPRAQLLQRYTLIAYLAPELLHGMASVREAHGVSVQTIVTCGNLPELRSLTMPLIEELDREVETLDSTDGLAVAPNGRSEGFSELTPALRLAAAAALADSQSAPARWSFPTFARIAAAAAVVATVAWAAYSYWGVSPSRTGFPESTSRARVGQAPPRGSATATTASTTPVGSTSRPAQPIVDSSARPVATQGNRQSIRAPRSSGEGLRPQPQTMIGSVEMPRNARQAPEAVSAPAGPARGAAIERERASRLKSEAVPEHPAAPLTANRTAAAAAPLREPLPKIDTVLIDQDRRLVLIDGSVAGVGDSIGSRVIVQIERDAVVLREPSGRTVRVRVRS